jgi:hypothetical protein
MAIKIKASHKGLLHKDLGVKSGSKIPASKLAKAKKSSNPAVRKRATFAMNAKGWSHNKKKKGKGAGGMSDSQFHGHKAWSK